MVQPYGADAPFGVGYVDGFGEHSPKPARKPPASRSYTRPASAAPVVSARITVPLPTATPSALAPAMSSQLTAVYWTTTWNTTYDTYVWVSNEGDAQAEWEVRVKLPAGATVTTAVAARRSNVDGTWVFTSTRGALRAGRIYLFAFSGTRGAGDFRISLCQVNGVPCVRFR